VEDSGHFDSFRIPLFSTSFCIHLIINHFQKPAEVRYSAWSCRLCHPASINAINAPHFPPHTGKVSRFPAVPEVRCSKKIGHKSKGHESAYILFDCLRDIPPPKVSPGRITAFEAPMPVAALHCIPHSGEDYL